MQLQSIQRYNTQSIQLIRTTTIHVVAKNSAMFLLLSIMELSTKPLKLIIYILGHIITDSPSI